MLVLTWEVRLTVTGPVGRLQCFSSQLFRLLTLSRLFLRSIPRLSRDAEALRVEELLGLLGTPLLTDAIFCTLQSHHYPCLPMFARWQQWLDSVVRWKSDSSSLCCRLNNLRTESMRESGREECRSGPLLSICRIQLPFSLKVINASVLLLAQTPPVAIPSTQLLSTNCCN